MSSTPLLRQNSLHNVSRPTTSNPGLNHFYSAFSSTCARSNITPFFPLNLVPAKHFRRLRSLTKNRAAHIPSHNTLIVACRRFISLVLSAPLRLCASALIQIGALSCISCLSWSPCLAQQKVSGAPLPGTQPLTMEGDIAAQMVAGIDFFLLREIDRSAAGRDKLWHRDFSSPDAYNKSIEPTRHRLKKILGVVDERVPFDAPELIATAGKSALVGRGENYEIFAVRWPAIREVHGEGLLLVPKGDKIADIIAVPDADQTPEQICGLADGVPPDSQFARRLAENGCRVLVPTLVSREMSKRAPPGQPGRANLTNREYVYRPAFELGRHPIGYELQKILAAVDWFAKELGDKSKIEVSIAGDETRAAPPRRKAHPIGVMGYGEGGMLAFYAAATDSRIDNVSICGYFEPREQLWQQPIDRNVFSLLERF